MPKYFILTLLIAKSSAAVPGTKVERGESYVEK
jgi:hypothetical protein